MTCILKGVCLTCDAKLNLVLNTILASCECAPGFHDNYIVSTNATLNNTLNTTVPCLACPQNCLYCLNSTFCLACNTKTYLNSNGSCLYICDSAQMYNSTDNQCTLSSSAMFDQ